MPGSEHDIGKVAHSSATGNESKNPEVGTTEVAEDSLRDAKLRALGEFAAGAGHEINNPLATIIGRVELLSRRLKPEMSSGELQEFRRDLAVVSSQAHRIRDMIGDLMLFARPPRPARQSLDLCRAVCDAARPFRELAALREISLTLPETHATLWINADPVQTAVVVSELLRNAIQAVKDRGRIDIRLDRIDIGGQVFARLRVSDDGRGLTPADREHLFDPFYSGRPAGRGLGFGLCKCWRIMELHDGRIDIVCGDPGGTVAEVLWPSAGHCADDPQS